MNFITYVSSTGRIIGDLTAEYPPPEPEWPAPGCAWLEGQYLESEYYVVSGVPTTRPANPAAIDTTSIVANGTDTATVSGIESGALVSVTDPNGSSQYAIYDGSLLVSSATPGVFRIQVRGIFPTKDVSFTVTAT
jgi:hypothetical protein